MLKFFRRSISQADPGKILFVIGTGRSGTHFLTRCLIGHDQMDDLTGGRENPRIFPLVTEAAVNRSTAPTNLAKARRRYSSYARKAAPGWFVDQSHPNIWHAELWAAVFPHAKFAGIVRKPYAVVASMLRHDGVRRWTEEWEKYPLPNDFLGITVSGADQYRRMDTAARCTIRWVAHYRRMQDLERKLGSRIQVVQYESLCLDPEATLAEIAIMCELTPKFQLPAVQQESLVKYQSLPPSTIESVNSILTSEGLDQFIDDDLSAKI